MSEPIQAASGNDKVIVEGILIPTRSIKAHLLAAPAADTGEVKQEWIPISQISKEVRVTICPRTKEETYRYYVPRWLAEAKGLEYLEEADGDPRDSPETYQGEKEGFDDFDEDIPF